MLNYQRVDPSLFFAFRLRHLRWPLGEPLQQLRQPLLAARRQRAGARPGAASLGRHGVAGGGDGGPVGHAGALGKDGWKPGENRGKTR